MNNLNTFELIVPVPFNAEEYKKDFDDSSQLEFDDLLNQAKRSFALAAMKRAQQA